MSHEGRPPSYDEHSPLLQPDPGNVPDEPPPDNERVNAEPAPGQAEETDPGDFSEPNPDDIFFENGHFPNYLVVKHRDPSKNIVKEDPFNIEMGLKEIVGSNTYKHLSIESSYKARMLTIGIDTKATAEKLYNASHIHDTPVKVEIHRGLNYSKGVVYSDAMVGRNKEHLKNALRNEGVTDIFHVPSTPQRKSRTFFLTFARPVAPEHIMVGYIRTKVHKYQPKAQRCTNCQAPGHGKKTCRNNQACVRCGAEDDHELETCVSPIQCKNCKGDHMASYKLCPAITFETEVLQHADQHKLPKHKARTHILRTRPDLANAVPYLKEKRENLPLTASDRVRNVSAAPASQQGPIQQIPPQAAKRIESLENVVHQLQQQVQDKDEIIKELRKNIRDMDQLKGTVARLESRIRTLLPNECSSPIFRKPHKKALNGSRAHVNDMDSEESNMEEDNKSKTTKNKRKKYSRSSSSSPEAGDNPAKGPKRPSAGANKMATPVSSQGMTSDSDAQKTGYSSAVQGSETEDGTKSDSAQMRKDRGHNKAWATTRNRVKSLDLLYTSHQSTLLAHHPITQVHPKQDSIPPPGDTESLPPRNIILPEQLSLLEETGVDPGPAD